MMALITSDPAISLDGFIAGPDQTLEHPLGVGGEALHRWHMGEHVSENEAEQAAIVEAGAFVMGRNMFGPVRGEWDRDWRGWWGEEPPYHAPVFVLTHYPHDPIEMEGGTTFHFVTGGPQEALDLALEATDNDRVSVCGGASTISQFLRMGLIDELRLHVAPVLLGRGESPFAGVTEFPFEVASSRADPLVTHVTLRRTSAPAVG